MSQAALPPVALYAIGPDQAAHPAPLLTAEAVEAIQTHGAVKGLILTVWRILRCNPLGGQGFDPVPPKGQFRLPHYWQGRKGHF